MDQVAKLFSSKKNESKNKDWSAKKLADLNKTQTLRIIKESKAGRTKTKDLNNKKEEEARRKALAAEKADAIINSLSSVYRNPVPQIGEIGDTLRSAATSLPTQKKVPGRSATDALKIDVKIEEMRKKNAAEKADSILNELMISSVKPRSDVKQCELESPTSCDKNGNLMSSDGEEINEDLALVTDDDDGGKKAEEDDMEMKENDLFAKWNTSSSIQHTQSRFPVNKTFSLEVDELESQGIKLDDELQLCLDTAAASRQIRFPVASQILGSESLYFEHGLGTTTLYQDWYSRVGNKKSATTCFAKLIRKK